MNLSTTLALYLGFFIESMWLWEAASERFSKTPNEQIKAPGASWATTIIGIALAIGATLIWISELLGETPFTDSANNILSITFMGIAMFFILIVGAVGGWLVPRVNEYNIVGVLAIVALNTLTQNDLRHPLLVSVLIGIPLVLSIALVFQKTSPTPAGKTILYLLYLGALIWLTLQSGILAQFRQTESTMLEAFVFGGTLCFLAIHTLLGLRFLVITTSFVLPENRNYISLIMRNLFKDEQLAPPTFFLSMAAILAAVLLNQRWAFFPADSFAAVLVILSTQLLFRPNSTSERV